MLDSFGREINYLRLSLTDRCNFRCRYCMPSEGVPKLQHQDMLRLEELFEIVRIFVTRLGFAKVRVTGGEPLVRRGAIPFLKSLHLIPGIRDLSLTTNGFYLAEAAAELHASGFGRVNISLDTLRADRFRKITGVDGLHRVLEGIEAARAAGFAPIKINTVAIPEIMDEVADLVAFGVEKGLQIRFIELMPVRSGASGTYISSDRVREILASRYRLDPLARDGDPSAAKLYRIDGTEATCGFITSISHPFCDSCNRIRMRADGKLKPCMASSLSHDVMPFVRPELRPEALEAFLRESVFYKRRCRGDYEIDAMSAFGG